MEKGSTQTERDKMSEARSVPIFFHKAGWNGHLYDHLTCYVSFPPRSYEEMEFLDTAIWRYMYPYQVIEDIKEDIKNAGNN